jgi:hypothetical protein
MSASRSRQKRKLEPISIEELAGATGMSGFCTFLTRDASTPVPVLDQVETSAPDTPAPKSPALVPRYGESIELQVSAPDSAPLETGAPDSRYRRRPRIREAVTVEDGHSLAEEAVYEAMCREGKPYRGDSRILTIGLRTLAELSRMAYSNCKANVRSLVAKLALDELPGFSYTDGRTYIIYSRDEILRRRQAAGLTHVLRTRGVAFVDKQTGAPKSSAPVSNT